MANIFRHPSFQAALNLSGIVLLSITLGCFSPSSSDELGRPSKTVDVPPSLEVPTENDIVAAPRVIDLSGVMPSNFPKNLPLFVPSSLVNFGDDDRGPWVDLLTDDPRIHVERSLLNQLDAAGWSAHPTPNAIELRNGGRKVRLVFRDGSPGTLYRYEY